MHKAKLVLKDGSVFHGNSFGYQKSVAGELVFNTAMTGYPESLTDPSYKGQILVATYPLIGNYGVPGNELLESININFESDKIHLSGFVISEFSEDYSHWNAKISLSEWMNSNKVPGIYGVDTRALAKIIREKGSMPGKIIFEDNEVDFYTPKETNLVKSVSIQHPKIYGNGKNKIILIDCGLKNNIIRHLLNFDTTIKRVPWDYDFTKEEYDGLFISNGPGDPKECHATIENLKTAFENTKPIFGICLGSQLMALAAGGDTYKMNFGHRGHNQPVLNLIDNKAYITSQNHGYAVDSKSLPPEWKPLFININDKSVEGIYHLSKPFFATQFHPEASGGPTDTEFLFDEFINNLRIRKNV